MANGWSIVISLAAALAAAAGAWGLSPRGEQQTVWRSTMLLATASCWLMWFITFLAQWHPLIAPERGDLRGEFHRERGSGL